MKNEGKILNYIEFRFDNANKNLFKYMLHLQTSQFELINVARSIFSSTYNFLRIKWDKICIHAFN